MISIRGKRRSFGNALSLLRQPAAAAALPVTTVIGSSSHVIAAVFAKDNRQEVAADTIEEEEEQKPFLWSTQEEEEEEDEEGEERIPLGLSEAIQEAMVIDTPGERREEEEQQEDEEEETIPLRLSEVMQEAMEMDKTLQAERHVQRLASAFEASPATTQALTMQVRERGRRQTPPNSSADPGVVRENHKQILHQLYERMNELSGQQKERFPLFTEKTIQDNVSKMMTLGDFRRKFPSSSSSSAASASSTTTTTTGPVRTDANGLQARYNMSPAELVQYAMSLRNENYLHIEKSLQTAHQLAEQYNLPRADLEDPMQRVMAFIRTTAPQEWPYNVAEAVAPKLPINDMLGLYSIPQLGVHYVDTVLLAQPEVLITPLGPMSLPTCCNGVQCVARTFIAGCDFDLPGLILPAEYARLLKEGFVPVERRMCFCCYCYAMDQAKLWSMIIKHPNPDLLYLRSSFHTPVGGKDGYLPIYISMPTRTPQHVVPVVGFFPTELGAQVDPVTKRKFINQARLCSNPMHPMPVNENFHFGAVPNAIVPKYSNSNTPIVKAHGESRSKDSLAPMM